MQRIPSSIMLKTCCTTLMCVSILLLQTPRQMQSSRRPGAPVPTAWQHQVVRGLFTEPEKGSRRCVPDASGLATASSRPPPLTFISLPCIHFTFQHQDLDVPCSGHTFLGQCKSSRVFVLFNFILYPHAPPPLRHRFKLCLSSLFPVSVCKMYCCLCVCARLCLCGSVASFFTRDSVKT